MERAASGIGSSFFGDDTNGQWPFLRDDSVLSLTSYHSLSTKDHSASHSTANVLDCLSGCEWIGDLNARVPSFLSDRHLGPIFSDLAPCSIKNHRASEEGTVPKPAALPQSPAPKAESIKKRATSISATKKKPATRKVQARGKNHGPWTPDEDTRLKQAIDRYSQNAWNKISNAVRTRTSVQCKQRYTKVLDPSVKKGPWSPDEDMSLEQSYAKYGRQWSKVAESIPGRNAKQVRERWIMSLQKDIKRAPFSPIEDENLIYLVAQTGASWAELAGSSYFPQRSSNQLKTRHKTLMRAAEKDKQVEGMEFDQKTKLRLDALTEEYDSLEELKRHVPIVLKGLSFNVLCSISPIFAEKFGNAQSIYLDD